MPRAPMDFSPASPGETALYSFNFIPASGLSPLASGETIISATVVMAVTYGVDATPGSHLIGSPSITGAVVSQKIGGLVLDVTYHVTATATTSTGQVLPLCVALPCRKC